MEKEWEEDREWKKSMLGLMMSMSQRMSGMERQLTAVEQDGAHVGRGLGSTTGAD